MSNARTPTGSAGGGLSGTYPNPSVTLERLFDGGTSASGTPGTQIAEIEAGADKHLVMISGVVRSDQSSRAKVIYEYIDETTDEVDSANAAAEMLHGNDAGVQSQTTGSARLVRNAAKKVKKVTVETFGSGTGSRFGYLAALEAAV